MKSTLAIAALSEPSPDELPVPGTQHLLKLVHNHQDNTIQKKDSIILIPIPSSSQEDPLNWSPKRKNLATFCFCFYTFTNGFALSNLYPILTPFSSDSGISITALNAGTGYLFLLAGWGLFLMLPFALTFGKRLTYIVSLLGIVAMMIWSPYIKSEGQWYARCILCGFFTSPSEALPELSVTDICFAHERGRYMALYALVLIGSNFISPLVCGFINDGQGWRWVFYYPTILCGATVIFLFFFMEETNYNRISFPQQEASPSEKTTIPHEQTAQSLADKTYLQKLSLLPPSSTAKPSTFLTFLRNQAIFLTFPIPLYAGFAYGSTLIWYNVLNATTSVILSAPPYSFTTSIVGLCYVAPLIGIIIAFLLTGRLSDWLAIRLARRNGGMMEPESRLWLFSANVVIIPAGLILWGVGASHTIPWPGLLVGMAMLGFQNAVGATLGVTYLVDCYREMSGSALTAVIVVRNTMSFAIGYGVTPWIDRMGLQDAFITAAAVGLVASLPFLAFLRWGKALRGKSRAEYWKLVAKRSEKGTMH